MHPLSSLIFTRFGPSEVPYWRPGVWCSPRSAWVLQNPLLRHHHPNRAYQQVQTHFLHLHGPRWRPPATPGRRVRPSTFRFPRQRWGGSAVQEGRHPPGYGEARGAVVECQELRRPGGDDSCAVCGEVPTGVSEFSGRAWGARGATWRDGNARELWQLCSPAWCATAGRSQPVCPAQPPSQSPEWTCLRQGRTEEGA